ncbi:MAG: hypothetical protein RI885_1900, partial [Actinomycetota bacterium]
MTTAENPAVTARVEPTWAALEVDGQTETIRADTEEEVRHEVLRRTIEIAAESNADAHLTATDSDGEWHLIVSPDGDISETGTSRGQHGTADDVAPVSDGVAPTPADAPVNAPVGGAEAPSTDDEELAASFLPFYIPPPPGSMEPRADP